MFQDLATCTLHPAACDLTYRFAFRDSSLTMLLPFTISGFLVIQSFGLKRDML
jgi:hypothetical protein